MSIQTYDELKTAILRWLVRDTDSDASTRVAEWIELFESRARRTLRANMGELRIQNLGVIGAYTSLPSDYVSHRSFKLLSGDENVLEYMPPHEMDEKHGSTTSANPTHYCVVGNALRLSPAPSATISVEALYYALQSLNTVQTTNWLLTAHPDAYLHGSLAEAYKYYQDDNQEDRSWTRSEAILRDINASSSQFRSSSPIQASAHTRPV